MFWLNPLLIILFAGQNPWRSKKAIEDGYNFIKIRFNSNRCIYTYTITWSYYVWKLSTVDKMSFVLGKTFGYHQILLLCNWSYIGSLQITIFLLSCFRITIPMSALCLREDIYIEIDCAYLGITPGYRHLIEHSIATVMAIYNLGYGVVGDKMTQRRSSRSQRVRAHHGLHVVRQCSVLSDETKARKASDFNKLSVAFALRLKALQ